MREARVMNETDIERVRAYLPASYEVEMRGDPLEGSDPEMIIFGEDVAGWTLDDYVIPRLGSGLIFAEEII